MTIGSNWLKRSRNPWRIGGSQASQSRRASGSRSRAPSFPPRGVLFREGHNPAFSSRKLEPYIRHRGGVKSNATASGTLLPTEAVKCEFESSGKQTSRWD